MSDNPVYTMDEKLRESVFNLVWYNYASEERDIEENGYDDRHIFNDIERLQAWLESNAPRRAR